LKWLDWEVVLNTEIAEKARQETRPDKDIARNR
jgi:hypothetical protein